MSGPETRHVPLHHAPAAADLVFMRRNRLFGAFSKAGGNLKIV